MKNRINSGLSKVSFHLPKLKVFNKPTVFLVESTNRCNLACVMCPYEKQTRQKGFMDSGLFKKIVDDGWLDYSAFVRLHGMGEPLLNNQLLEFIDYADMNGISTEISTNVCALNSAKANGILESPLTQIILSLDGATKETYEKIRRKADYHRSLKNIQNFLELKKKGQYRIKTILQIIFMEDTVNEINDFVKYWKQFGGVDQIRIRFYNTWANQVDEIVQKSDNFIGKQKAEKKQQPVRHPCRLLWESVTIQYDGLVVPCCRDYDSKYVLGDIKNESLEAIWNGPRMQVLRKEHLEGNYNNPLCCKCMDYSYGEPDILGFMGGLFTRVFKTSQQKTTINKNSMSDSLRKIIGDDLDTIRFDEGTSELNIYFE